MATFESDNLPWINYEYIIIHILTCGDFSIWGCESILLHNWRAFLISISSVKSSGRFPYLLLYIQTLKIIRQNMGKWILDWCIYYYYPFSFAYVLIIHHMSDLCDIYALALDCCVPSGILHIPVYITPCCVITYTKTKAKPVAAILPTQSHWDAYALRRYSESAGRFLQESSPCLITTVWAPGPNWTLTIK